jgi:hypothetical protein
MVYPASLKKKGAVNYCALYRFIEFGQEVNFWRSFAFFPLRWRRKYNLDLRV